VATVSLVVPLDPVLDGVFACSGLVCPGSLQSVFLPCFRLNFLEASWLFLPPFGFIPFSLFGTFLWIYFGSIMATNTSISFSHLLGLCFEHLQNVIWFSTDE
jgi:hypothetical protein